MSLFLTKLDYYMYNKESNISIVTACGIVAHNIGNARLISYGDVDVMVAGGVEMATTRCFGCGVS